VSELKSTAGETVAIVATFTAEPILPLLRFVLHEAGVALEPKCSQYNQVFQELLSTTGLLASNVNGVNIIIIRMEDFLRESPGADAARALLTRTTRELMEAFSQYSRRARSPTMLLVLDRSPDARTANQSALDEAAAALVKHAQSLPDVHVVTQATIDDVFTGERCDPVRDSLAHIPYTEEFYGSLAYAMGRQIHALRLPSQKVLVLDCDNTLWRGVIAEDGLDGITISDACLRVQQFAIEQQMKGVLLCLASSNSEGDVLEVFAKKPGMALKLEHIVSHRINWQPKSGNLASLASELGLGLESFVFLDDNPIECAKMRAELPQVVTLQLPPDEQVERFLAHLWVFDRTVVTEEDTVRTKLYRANAARQSHHVAASDLAAFVASLELKIDIGNPHESEWARVAQLSQRTNQFNFTTIRRSEAEMRAEQLGGSRVLRANVRDRFGDYGLVGLMVLRSTAEALIVDTLLLSCRVLGRGVEHAMLRRVGELAAEQGLACVELPYVLSARNEPARAFADSVAANFRSGVQNAVIYKIPSDFASNIVFRPGTAAQAAISAAKSEDKAASSAKTPQISSFAASRSERYARLAQQLDSGSAILNAVRAQDKRVRSLSNPLVAPATTSERRLASLWQEMLHVDALGVEDDYFALGGTSLLAVRLFAAIQQRFGVKLRLATLLESPTVRALARHIDPKNIERRGNLVELKRGGKQNLFLVHDGDGETLLYRNLARRLPDNLAVLGIEPRRIPKVPLAHTRIEDMARFYIEEVRRKQPSGPYMIGGLCAGGVIAYEMASQLKLTGEHVRLLAILDAAKPRAAERPGRLAMRRARRLQAALAEPKHLRVPLIARAYHLVNTLSKKLVGFVLWTLFSGTRQLSTRIRFRVLREVLRRGLSWPSFLAELSVREIYESAEARYIPKALAGAGVLLVRAQSGEDDDTPYREIFADDFFGWKSISAEMDVIDVKGGHSSMLQEPFVESLASALTRKLRHELEPFVTHRGSEMGGRGLGRPDSAGAA
jgi:FkbH-like protein